MIFFVQPSSGKLSPAANENKYKEPQPDIPKRKRPWNTKPQMRYFHQAPPLRVQGTLQKRRQKECKSKKEWMEGTKKPNHSEPTGSVRSHMN